MTEREGKDILEYTKTEPCLRVDIPEKAPLFDASALPFDYDIIPAHVRSLQGCAEHHIRALMGKETLTAQDEDALDDGFVMCDFNVVRRKLQVWRKLFPRVKPFFALKCNPDPVVAWVLGQSLAAGFDCASVPEIRLALQSVDTSSSGDNEGDDDERHRHVVYANPQRAEKDLDTALRLSVTALTFDGPEELIKVHRAHQKRLKKSETDSSQEEGNASPRRSALSGAGGMIVEPPNMILRILVPDEHSAVPLGEKFGAPPAQWSELTELAVRLGLPIVGVSFHCGSGNHNPAAYRQAIHLAAEAMDAINRIQQQRQLPPCWLLDIGGGFPGRDGMGGDVGRFCGSINRCIHHDEAEGEATAEIADAVTPLLDRLFPRKAEAAQDQDKSSSLRGHQVQFIAEPGRYFVEGAFALCSRIYRVRSEQTSSGRRRRHYYIAQGVQGVFKDCVLCGESFVPLPLSLTRKSGSSSHRETTPLLEPSTVHGPSGEDFDVVCRDYPLPVLEVGDWLVFDRMGAYTLSIAARNGRLPVRYVMGCAN